MPFQPTTDDAVMIDHPDAPDVYMDGFHGILVRDGVVRLNLYRDHAPPADTDGRLERHVVARLLMPLPVFLRVAEASARIVKDLEKDGIIALVAAPSGEQK